jgi:hypothetical protein
MAILGEEVGWFRRLLELLLEQKELILVNDIESFQRNLQRQEACVGEIEQLERSRREQIARLSEELGIPARELNLSKIVGMVLGEYRAGLQELQAALREVIGEIGRAAKYNGHLMNKALYFIRKNFECLVQLGDLHDMYDGGAKKGGAGTGRSLVNRRA